MKKLFELFLHKTVFFNSKTFILSIIAVPFIPLILLAIDFELDRFNNDIFYRGIYLTSIIILLIFFPFFIKIIRNAKKDSKNFGYIKYISCSVDTFKLFKKTDQIKFYNTIIIAIREKDLKYSQSRSNKYNPSQNDFLKTINTENFKEKILYELDFERFQDIINSYKRKEWIRQIFWYKYKFREGAKIILQKLTNHPDNVDVDVLTEVFINNLNLTESGVNLNPKELKTDIDLVLNNKNKLSPNLTLEQKEVIFDFLKSYFRVYTEQDIKNLINLDIHLIIGPLKLKKTNTSLSLLFLLLLKKEVYSRDEIDSIFDCNKIEPSRGSRQNFDRKVFSKYLNFYKKNKKIIHLSKDYKKSVSVLESLKTN